jgi:hypothetical protein
MSAGYVVNREDRRGRPGRYALGEPLPEDLEILPSLPPDHLASHETAGQGGGGTVASESEGVDTFPSPTLNGQDRGFPAVVEAIRGFLGDQPDAEAEDITEELGYAPVTVRAALTRIEEEES